MKRWILQVCLTDENNPLHCLFISGKMDGADVFHENHSLMYEVRWRIRNIRIMVLSQIPKTERNAVWLMFSAVPDKVGFGTGRFLFISPH